MTHHIPFLKEIILLCALTFPGGLSVIIPRAKKNTYFYTILGNVVINVLLIALVLPIAREQYFYLNVPPAYMYPIALLVGLLCIILEYAVGAIQFVIKNKKLPDYRVHAFYDIKVAPALIALIIVLVVCEELILRQFMFTIFYNTIGLGLLLTVLVCAFIYSLNHLYFGVNTLVQKFVSGLVYTLLFYFSGSSVVVPIIAHSVQNLTLLFLSSRGGRK
jgi:uncharacterized protein